MEWINVNDNLPKEDETVWMCNAEKQYVWLGCLTYHGHPSDEDSGWLWAVTNGTVWVENGEIVSECELDDDYDVTHWMSLPKLPSKH